jgi:ParB-like chromosome segregation protein Spo0J
MFSNVQLKGNAMEWVLVQKNIRDLKPHPHNPRKLSKYDYEHLQKSLDKFGLIDKPIINSDGTIIGGHQRVAMLKRRGAKEIECWLPKIALTPKEADELTIRLNANHGAFDYDILANDFDEDELREWGMDDIALGLDDLPQQEPEDEKEEKKCPMCGKKIKSK